ncbi:MAG TPA: Gldg family protein, partial [Vicinamibacterales bacterium]
ETSGYNSISSALTSSNFVVDKLVLAQQTAVPADADIIVVAGPRTDFLAPEIDMLKAYLAKGGKLLMLLDPVIRQDEPQLTSLQALAHDWGMTVGNDVVLDVSGMGRLIGTDESVPVAAGYPSHPITQNFSLMTAYPLARSVTPVDGGVNGHTAQPIVQTSTSSWAESDIKDLAGGKPAKYDAGDDKKGPITLAAAVSAPAANAPAPPAGKPADDGQKPETRVVVFGDSDFAGNGALGVRGNRDLFLNTINWLAQQENLIAIRPHDVQDRRITLTADQAQRIFYLTVLIVPGLILLAGVQTWWRRR